MDSLFQTRTSFENSGPVASRGWLWPRGDGSDGSSFVACSVHSIGIVVPFPAHHRKNAYRSRRDESRKRRQIGRSFGAANGDARSKLVHALEWLEFKY